MKIQNHGLFLQVSAWQKDVKSEGESSTRDVTESACSKTFSLMRCEVATQQKYELFIFQGLHLPQTCDPGHQVARDESIKGHSVGVWLLIGFDSTHQIATPLALIPIPYEWVNSKLNWYVIDRSCHLKTHTAARQITDLRDTQFPAI
jgi:hypothetical protein